MNRSLLLSFVVAALLLPTVARAELRLPAIFGHHMVLQRDQENPIWGWAKPDAAVRITFAGTTIDTKADSEGNWKAKLPSLPGSSHALNLTLKSDEEQITLSNVVIGEVWVCSGQSNMEWPVSRCDDPDLEIATANYPNIRFISVPRLGTQEKQTDFDGQWDICTPATVGSFSAVGYYFGRQLYQTLGVPIGLVDNAWGGSAAEAWVERGVLEKDGRFESYLTEWQETEKTFDYETAMAEWREKVKAAKEAGTPPPRAPRNLLTGQHRPGNLWAGVLHPLIGYGIRGVIWYQGETNAKRAYQYDDLFGLMITEWRKAWGQGDFPFYWVQLADYKEEVETPGESDWAELREAQSQTLALPHTGQAVIYDLGEGRDIHPRDKQNVAKRLARIALAKNYGMEIHHQSPSFKSMEIQGNKALLTFENVGSKLYTFDTKDAVGFAIAGEDRVWHNAKGTVVDSNQVEVTSEAVAAPVAVRYAWATNPVANLRSREGLPAVPFRTDDWPQITDPATTAAATPAEPQP